MPFFLKRTLAVLLVLVFLLSPVTTHAHYAFFLQVLIDTNNYTYQANVLEDSASTILDLESAHIEAQLGDFSHLIKDNYAEVPTDGYEESKVDGEAYLPFTFTPIEAGDGWFDGKSVNHATQADANRAYVIKDTLIPGLNDALRILNGGNKYQNIKSFVEMSSKLASAIRSAAPKGTATVQGYDRNGNSKTYTIRVGYRASYSKHENDLKRGIMNDDYLVISDGANEYEFVYRMQKGYKEKGAWDNQVYRDNLYKLQGDTKYITWNMLMYQAIYAYQAKGYTIQNGSEVVKPGPLEEAVVGMLENLFNGLRNFLSLYSMNELIYNEGIRGSSAWYYGAMPMAWERNVIQYHMIFQALAWSLIIFAIIKALIQRNLSTINPSMRVSLIEQIKDLLLTGAILTFILPMIDMFLMFNSKLVEMFKNTSVDFDNMSGLNNYTNTLAGIILQFFYFLILIYMNFVYIIRAITLAVLTATGPLFAVTIAFGGRWKGLFNLWMRELLANIFIQSFHAFLLSFLFLAQTTSRGIEVFVLCFALLPLTEFFRQLMLGQAGGVAGILGMKSLMMGVDLLTAGSRRRVSIKQEQEKNVRSESVDSGVSRQNSTGFVSEMGNIKSSDRLPMTSRTSMSASADSAVSYQAQREALLNKEIPISEWKDVKADPQRIESEHGKITDEKQAIMQDFKQSLRDINYDSIGEKGVKAIAGATTLAAGTAFALAFGGMDKGASKAGSEVVGVGGKMIASVGKSTASTVSRIGQVVGASLGSHWGSSGGAGGNATLDLNLDEKIVSSNVGGTPSAGGYMPEHTFVEGGTNGGDLIVHRTGVSAYGVVKAYDDPVNANYAKIHYDISKLNAHDLNNLKYYAQVFAGNDQAHQQWLRQHGIENVGFNRKGELIVTYNEIGKERLGFKSIQTMGDGRIIERKANNASLQTRLTIDVPLPIGLNRETPRGTETN